MIGVALGHFYPQLGAQMKPLGDAFIKMIKMIIAPIIFCTVVHGIASMQNMKKVGRVGLKALIYFEVLTTIALIVGLIVVNIVQPGAGMNVDVKSIDTRAIQGFVVKSKEQGTIQFLMDIIPNTVVGAFAQGEILQVLFFAVLFAFAYAGPWRARRRRLIEVIEQRRGGGGGGRRGGSSERNRTAKNIPAGSRLVRMPRPPCRGRYPSGVDRALILGLHHKSLDRPGIDRFDIDVHTSAGCKRFTTIRPTTKAIVGVTSK